MIGHRDFLSWFWGWFSAAPAPVVEETPAPSVQRGGSGVLGKMPPYTPYPPLHADTRRLREAEEQDAEEEALALALALVQADW